MKYKSLRFALCGLLLHWGTYALGQLTGICYTDRSNPFGIVSFTESSVLTDIGNTRHVDGYVKKYGARNFSFPVGHRGKFRPFGADADGIYGAYFNESPGSATLPSGGPYSLSSKDVSISQVSPKEFWDINGTNPTSITLSWNEESDMVGLTGSLLDHISIVGWNSALTKWEKIASVVDQVSITGSGSAISAGSITTVSNIVPDTYSIYALGSATTAAIPASYEGALELVSCGEVRGWVWDKNHANADLTIELVEGNTVYAVAKANIFREDVKNQGKGTGKYGFSISTPEALNDGLTHQLSVRVRSTNYSLSGSPKALNCSYEGKIQVADCYSINGWVWNRNSPDSSLFVELMEGNTVLATTQANIPQPGLTFGTTNYGYSFPLPISLRDGKSHKLSVRIKETLFFLTDSPVAIICATANYVGNFEAADCNNLSGWVWASNYPNSSFEIELLEGSTVIGTAIASNYRGDLNLGNKNYGFKIPFPLALKNGQPHQLSVRVKGTTYVLPGSPKSVTCAAPALYGGSFEYLGCDSIRGWAWSSNYPNSALTVEVLEGSTVRATSIANIYRADLKSAGTGTGNYGFSIALPAALKTGQARQLSVRVQSTTFVLPGSPRSITCATPAIYNGNFEVADCNKVAGWVSASNYPDSTLVVELVEGSTVVATGTAGIYRGDLSQGTKKYGFNIPLPLSLKNGQAHQLSVRVKGTTYVLPGSPKSVTCAAPSQYGGSFEYLGCDSIRGWAWSSNYPNSALTVEVLEGSTVRATSIANIYRADLKSAGTGTGNYGFSIALPAALKTGQARQLSVRVQSTTFVLPGSPRSITCATPAIYNGNFEVADCNKVAGWVSASNYPDSTLVVELVEGSTVVATGTAGIYRGDLSQGTKKYGFNIPLPLSLKNGQAHQLSVRVKGTTYVLPGSPKSVTCAAPALYGGSFEYLGCDSIRGWAWSSNYPNSALTVEVLEGSTVRATSIANIYRADLKSAGTGTGNYGFSIALPAALKTGQARQLSVRVQSTTFVLPGSPRSITCATPAIYNGNFEVTDCNKVAGWVSASNYPDSTLVVELVEGSTVVATGTAGIYRGDLSQGTKKYGFNIPLPLSLKNGQAHQLSVRVKGTTYVLPGSPKSVTCAAPSQYGGSFEYLGCDSIRGWAWSSNYPNSALTVEVLEGSTVRATSIANIYRADLKSAGTGTGNYGFSIALPAALKTGQARQLSVRVQSTTFVLPGSPRSITCATPAIYNGNFEVADCNKVAGWVSASNYPDSTLVVELVEGSTVVATGTAGIYRGDLSQGTKKYGFNIPLPLSLKNGQAHQLSVRVKGTTYVLPGSPKSVICMAAATYNGNFEVADCSKAAGWVSATNYPDSVLVVELMEGNTVLATGSAGIYRGDLTQGSKKYGFNIPLPSTVKNGQARQLSVRVKGSSYVVPGSPKSITCAAPEIFNGNFEVADCSKIAGWVWASNYPGTSFTVEIMEGNTVVGTTVANIYRGDMSIGTRNYGFRLTLPETLKNGQPRQLTARVKNSTYTLPGSPKTLTCVPSARISAEAESELANTRPLPDGEKLDWNFTVSPNPSSALVLVRFLIPAGQQAQLSVVNPVGRVIFKHNLTGRGTADQQPVDLEKQVDGVYIIRMQVGERSESRKIVLVK